jgi:molecular chaperone DnaK (HSP70)
VKGLIIMAVLSLDTQRGLYLGIDFGTTNSVVSIFDAEKGEAYTLPIDGGNVTPTVVQFEADMDDAKKLTRIFGVQAREAAIIYPQATVLGVKRLLGLDSNINIVVDDMEHTLSPVQVAGEIIGYLKQKANEYVLEELGIGGEFAGCVITVPANSTDKQKRATKDAAQLAGFDNVYLRPEPAAAAISYAVNETKSRRVLVYDFGGGTFDVCALNIDTGTGEPVISIAATAGANSLGGNDIDKIIMDIIYEEVKKQTDIDLFDENADDGASRRQKKVALVRMQQAATHAKERLSTTKSTKITLAPLLQEPAIVNINIELTRENFLTHARVNQLGDSDEIFAKFEGKSVENIVDETLAGVQACLESAELDAGDIDEIFLVGGSSGLPLVAQRVEEFFGKPPVRARISPALSISQGAAHYGHMIHSPNTAGPVVQEKTLHPLGIEIAGRRFLTIIPAGMDIPADGLEITAPEPFVTNADNLPSMAIAVWENTAPTIDKNLRVTRDGMKRLAGTSLRGIPPAPAGLEKVQISFRVSQDNMLTVSAKSLSQDGVETTLSVDDLYA